jgi:hypothetical protein
MTSVIVLRGKAITADQKPDRKLRTPLTNAEWILDSNFVIPSRGWWAFGPPKVMKNRG